MALRLSKLTFRAGAVPGGEATTVEPLEGIVVLVGPNSSGKSCALREIREWTNVVNATRAVVGELDAEYPTTLDEVYSLLDPFRRPGPPEGQTAQEGVDYFHFPHIYESTGIGPIGDRGYERQSVQNALTHPDRQTLRAWVLGPLTARLDGPTRFQLADDQQLGDLQLPPANHLAALFRDDAAREELRDMVHRALGRYPVMEAVGNGHVRIRLSGRPPSDQDEERGLTDRAMAFHREAPLLANQGDGARALVGLLAAVKALPHRILLIDEPEAFLHPPLARRLGRYLATVIAEREGTLITATHSGDFLTGCVDAGQPLSVVRLTYDGPDTATARVLDAQALTALMVDPLVRSARVLSGLFHRAVVVVEGDTDRVFYDEVNERLGDAGRGIDDALFINAHNWQTVGRLVEPLRRLGVPAAAILDLDSVVKAGQWGPLWRAMNLSEDEHQTLNDMRVECERLLRATENGGKPYKTEGLRALESDGRVVLARFVDELARHGVFLVPVGVLENWLPELAVEGKRSWIERVFGAMGTDPADAKYVHPGTDGPWAFLDRIESWVSDPQRAGMGLDI